MNKTLIMKINNSISNKTFDWNVCYTDDDFNEMLFQTKIIIKRILRSYSQIFTELENKIIFTTLIEIARRKKTNNSNDSIDKGFWNNVFYHLEIINTNTTYSMLIQSINTLSVVKASNKKKYYGTVLMHALAPQKSLFSFFDLCYNVYKNDLQFNFTQEDQTFIEYFAIRFAEIIDSGRIGESDDVSIGSNVYSIKIGIRQMSINMHKQFVLLIEKTIKIIDNLFHNISFQEEKNGYINEKIYEWWQNKFIVINSDQKIFKNNTKAVSQENVSVSYVLENNEVKILIPSIRLKEDGFVTVEVYNSNDQPKIFSINTRKNEFTSTTVQLKIGLDEVAKECQFIDINLKIISNNSLIYDSYDKLYRQFILLGNETEILKSLNEPNNYYFYTRDKSLIYEIKQKSILKSQISYHLYNIYPQPNDTINGKYRKIVFAEHRNSIINENIVLISRITNVIWVESDRHYLVFNSVPKLLVSRIFSLNGIEVRINSIRLVLTDMSDIIIDDVNNCYIFNFDQYIKNEETYNFSVYSYISEREIIGHQFILFSDLRIHFNESLLFSEDQNYLECSYNGKTIKKEFGLEREELIVDFCKGYLAINIPWMKWRIDNSQWANISIKAPLWYKNIVPTNGSILEFQLPDGCAYSNLKVYYSLDQYEFKNESFEIEGKDGRFDLGRLVYSIGQYDIIRLFVYYRDIKYNLMLISTNEHFISQPLIYSESKLFWSPLGKYIGNSESMFRLKLSNETNNYVFDKLSIQDEILNTGHIQEDVYKISIMIFQPNSLLNCGKEIYKSDFIFGTKEKYLFKNTEIIIEQVYCGYATSEDNMEFEDLIPTYFIDNLEYFSIDGFDYYLGNFGVYKKDGARIYLNHMRNSNGVYEKTNPFRIELITDNIIDIVAGFDINNPYDFLGNLFYNKTTKFIDNIINPNCINALKITTRRIKDV